MTDCATLLARHTVCLVLISGDSLNAKNLQQITDLFTDDAVQMMGSFQTVIGKDAVKVSLAQRFSAVTFGRVLHIDEVFLKLYGTIMPTNRLIHEKSPYLLQHAHNPVDWFPWGPEAFQKAARESRAV